MLYLRLSWSIDDTYNKTINNHIYFNKQKNDQEGIPLNGQAINPIQIKRMVPYIFITKQQSIFYYIQNITFQMESFGVQSSGNMIANQTELSYVRPLGSKKRKFQSIPDDYYPPSNKDIVIGSFALLFIILAFLGIMIGFMYWTFVSSTEIFIDVWVSIFLAYIVAIIIALYCGGKIKRVKEREMMREKLREQKVDNKKEVEKQT